MFKKLTCLFATLFLGLAQAHADEGMWFLMLMQQQHLADSLRKAGLQLPPSRSTAKRDPRFANASASSAEAARAR